MQNAPSSIGAFAGTPAQPSAPRNETLWKQAQKLEATFLSEMLKSAGLGEARSLFGGGIGEEQFSSFLREEQAGAMVEAGGLGLAETIYSSLLQGDDNDPR